MPATFAVQESLSVGTQQFLHEVLVGLNRFPKHLPCKYLYDRRGSELFEQICQLEEYYPTRAELGIMDEYAGDIAAQIGSRARLIEFGSGSSVKTRYLLDQLSDVTCYVPVDISGEHLQRTVYELERDYPRLEVLPVCTDFTQEFYVPESASPSTRSVVYFPGSTIGNFSPRRVARLLGQIARLCGPRGGLLIGIDLKKNVRVIEAAYNDAKGVTAEFNLNLLRRINGELGANFDLDQFSHRAHYNAEFGRVEMHLISRQAQTVTIDDQTIDFAAQETICTEYSHKYTIEEFATVAASAGLSLRRVWKDANHYFAVLYFANLQDSLKSRLP